jgi:hypothetical protein
MSPRHEGRKQNTIRVTRGTSAKLPHCTSPTLAYPMENKMPLVHDTIERWGCDYTDEDGKGLNERTRRHPMLKPKSKLMQVEWV